MKIIKEGNKKFVGIYRVPIFIGECKECNTTFEVQKHEIPLTGRMNCPYCRKYHDNYEFNYVRTDILTPLHVGKINGAKYYYVLEYVASDKVNTSYVSDDEEERFLYIEKIDNPYPSWIIFLRFILLSIISFAFIWWFFNKIVL